MTTPLLDRYHRLKAENPDAVVVLRVTEYCDSFGDDAEVLHQVLGARLVPHKSGLPMVVFHVRHLGACRQKLLDAGYQLFVEDEGVSPLPFAASQATLFAEVE